jgi:hypothetical protein
MDLSQWRSFKRHPLSEIFPDMSEVEFEALVADMKQFGYDQKQQILLFENAVLDGWHRLRAAVITSKTPTFDNYKGADAVGEVVRRNMTRRQLDASQRAMIAARIAEWQRGGSRSKASIDALKTQEKAAQEMNVGRASVQRAAKVVEQGTKKLQDAVDAGDIAVSDAAAIADEPARVQNAAVDAVRNGRATTARAAVAERKQPAPEPLKDKNGDAYPEQAQPAVQFVSRLRELETHLREGIEMARQIAQEPIGLYLDPSGIEARLNEAKSLVLAAHPYRVCKNCGGEPGDCEWCKGNGWQTRGQWMQCPEPK